MPAEFEQGFFVRVPAWHGLGIVLSDYPGREEAMRLAGHDFDIVELDEVRYAVPNEALQAAGQDPTGPNGSLRRAKGWKVHVRSDTLELIHVSKDSYHGIPNRIPYDFAEALIDQGFRYETGITLRGGAGCALTLLLNEPYRIPGDDSEILPYYGIDWWHDGSGAVNGTPTSVRRVCANTVGASKAEGARLGIDFSFSIRHTKNWREYVEDAKLALKGVRAQSDAVRELGEELADMHFSEESVREWVDRFCTPPEVLRGMEVSNRVASNVATMKGQMLGILAGPTIPEAHRHTGWGLYNAATEYLDHVRRTRGTDHRTKSEAIVQRTLLKPNRAKEAALELIHEVYATSS